MYSLTCEEISRTFNRLDVFRTVDSVVTLIQQNYLILEKAADGDRRYSKYRYRVSSDSFISYLKSRGFGDGEIREVLPQWG